jgi:hypothetical protein
MTESECALLQLKDDLLERCAIHSGSFALDGLAGAAIEILSYMAPVALDGFKQHFEREHFVPVQQLSLRDRLPSSRAAKWH